MHLSGPGSPRPLTFRPQTHPPRFKSIENVFSGLKLRGCSHPLRFFELRFDPGSGNLVFRASDRILRSPTAQIRHMGSEKSNDEIKNITAPWASAYSSPKIFVQQQKWLYRDVHGTNDENRRKNMQKFQLFCERKSAAYLLGLVIIFRTSLAAPTVLIYSGDVPLLLCISLRQ